MIIVRKINFIYYGTIHLITFEFIHYKYGEWNIVQKN